MICNGNWSPYLGLVKLMQGLLGAVAWLSLPWCVDDGNMVVFAKVVRRNSVSQCVIYDVLVIASEGRRASVNEL